MKLNHMRDVVAVAQCGSLRSAARYLGVPQPNISRSIRELEHELGVTLFERRVTGMVPTPMGHAFLRRATGIQIEMERTRAEIEQLKGFGIGTVSVGLSTVAYIALLPKVLGAFRQRFPDVLVKLSEGLFPSMEADIQAGRIDFYVGPLSEHVQPVELLVERWFGNEKVVVCRTAHPLQGATSLADLAEATWVTTSITLVGEAELAPLFDRLGLPRPRIGVQAATTVGMLVAVAASDTLAMLPQQWLDVVAATPMVERIMVRETMPAPVICCVRRAGLPLTPAAEHLCDLFRRAAANHARIIPGGSDLGGRSQPA